MAGRPTRYNEQMGDEICRRLVMGNDKGQRALYRICEADYMPGEVTVYRWLGVDDHPFRKKYARAREQQTERMLDECIEIADDSSRDTILKEGRDGEEYEVENREFSSRSKLRVETRLKLAALLHPRKYGTRIPGQDDGSANPLTIAKSIHVALAEMEERTSGGTV